MTRLDFSSMTPIRIQVLYWVSMRKVRISPTTAVVLTFDVVLPGCRLCTGSGLAWASADDWAGERWASASALATPSVRAVAATNCAPWWRCRSS